jgi:hypothetical protein
MMSWSRLLRAIGFGGPTYFPDLGPEMTGAASPRRKGALILTGIVLAAAGTFSLGAVIFVQLSTLKIEVASLKRELAGTTGKLAKLEANVTAARSHTNEIKDGADARMLASAGSIPRAPLVLTRDEIQLILDVIKVAPPLPWGSANHECRRSPSRYGFGSAAGANYEKGAEVTGSEVCGRPEQGHCGRGARHQSGGDHHQPQLKRDSVCFPSDSYQSGLSGSNNDVE